MRKKKSIKKADVLYCIDMAIKYKSNISCHLIMERVGSMYRPGNLSSSINCDYCPLYNNYLGLNCENNVELMIFKQKVKQLPPAAFLDIKNIKAIAT